MTFFKNLFGHETFPKIIRENEGNVLAPYAASDPVKQSITDDSQALENWLYYVGIEGVGNYSLTTGPVTALARFTPYMINGVHFLGVFPTRIFTGDAPFDINRLVRDVSLITGRECQHHGYHLVCATNGRICYASFNSPVDYDPEKLIHSWTISTQPKKQYFQEEGAPIDLAEAFPITIKG